MPENWLSIYDIDKLEAAGILCRCPEGDED